jgi:hypothetical protein
MYSFKIENIEYEVFVDSDHVEIYEKEKPQNGLIFESKKQLISFINYLTDLTEEEIL